MLPSFLQNLSPEIYHSKNYVVVDFETDTQVTYGSAIHPENGLLLASWRLGEDHPFYKAWGDCGTMSQWGGEFDQGELVQAIEDADFFVAHNAKYELMWLERCGLDLRTVLPFDTKIAEYVLLGNLAAGDKMMAPKKTSLDMCCRRRGLPIKDPVVDILIKNGVNPKYIPRPWLQGRCEQDVETTEEVFLSQLSHLTNTSRLGCQYTRCLLTPALSAMEFEGVCLDEGAVLKEYEEYSAKRDLLSAQMDKVTGNINWRSPKQVAEFIYDTLGFKELRNRGGAPKRNKPNGANPEGTRKTDKDTIEAILPQATTKRQKEFVSLKKELGKVNAALSKNLDFFIGVCKEHGGIFHAEFNQTKTATHRLSSSGIPLHMEMFDKDKTVQLQNSPRAFKPLYKARRKGWLVAEADGSQLEFRTAAFQGGDSVATADIISGHDVHRFTASVLNHITEDEVVGEQRQQAKPDTFKPLYGGESGTEDQQRYYKAFRERYPELAETQQGWVHAVINEKRLITPWGLRYYWPFASLSQSGYCNVKSSVFNYPIQALATAEIIPVALVFLWHRVREAGIEDKVVLVNTVHDSVICEIDPSVQEEFTNIAIQCFTVDVYKYLEEVYDMDFHVPLGVGIKVGERWGTGEERSFNVFQDGNIQEVA